MPDRDILQLRSLKFENAANYSLPHIEGREKDPEWNYLTAFCLQIINREKEKALEYHNKALLLDYDEGPL